MVLTLRCLQASVMSKGTILPMKLPLTRQLTQSPSVLALVSFEAAVPVAMAKLLLKFITALGNP